jgi:phosphate-selective porin OprO and OprP
MTTFAALFLTSVVSLTFAAPAFATESPAVPEIEQSNMATRSVDPSKIAFKPGKGLEISSEDGDFKLITRLRAQLRYTLEQEDGDLAHGMQLRRARLLFKGHMFGKENGYKFELAVSPKDIGLKSTNVGTISKSPMLDWYFNFSHLRDLTIRLGQYKVPYSRQRVVSSGNLQFVDRSMVNGEFNLDRDVGFDLRSKDLFGLGLMRYYAGVYMGEGHSSWDTGDFGMMYLGRLEFLPLGLFKDYSEGAFERSPEAKLSVGVGFAYLDEGKKNKGIIGSAPADGGTTDTMNLTADLTFRVSGLSLESAFFLRDGTRNAGETLDEVREPIPTEEPRDGMGFYTQAGYLLPNTRVEVAGRYGQVLAASADTSLGDSSEAGLGLSYYMAQHAMKIQGDYFHAWGEDGFSAGSDEARLQMQFAY